MLPPAMLTGTLVIEETQPTKWWQSEDTHLFVMSFFAFFLVFYSFIY